jgi:hypothetical protein
MIQKFDKLNLLADSVAPFDFPFAVETVSPLETNKYGVNTPYLHQLAWLNFQPNERMVPSSHRNGIILMQTVMNKSSFLTSCSVLAVAPVAKIAFDLAPNYLRI